jgi:poly(A) polymerase
MLVINMKVSPEIRLDKLSLPAALPDCLSKEKVKTYLVGGVLRDLIMERDGGDIDIAVCGDSLKIGGAVAASMGGSFVPLDEYNAISRVILHQPSGNRQIDFTAIPDDIESDLKHRDFTINALAVDLADINRDTAPVIDPCGGLDDIAAATIRAVNDDVFQADPLRLLRAVRLAGELDFSIADDTLTLMKRDAARVVESAGERLREELLRILAASGEKHWQYFENTGLLTALIPELAAGIGVGQPDEHAFDVYRHALETVTALDYLLGHGDWQYGRKEAVSEVEWSTELDEYFNVSVSHGSNRRQLLKLSALLHDIAKPQTKTVDPGGRIRFLEHAEEGAATATAICRRLRFSNHETGVVETAVKYHMRPNQMSQSGPPSRRAIYRFFRDTGEHGLGILVLSLADHLAARGPNLIAPEWQRHCRLVNYVITEKNREVGIVNPPRLLNGHQLMYNFKLNPGPMVGEILEKIREAQADGLLETTEDAIVYVRRLLTDHPGPAAKPKNLVALV